MIQSLTQRTPDDFEYRLCKGLEFVQNAFHIGEDL